MRFTQKFKSQIEDLAAGNNLRAREFRENINRYRKEFKCCFSLADPRVVILSKKVSPNYRC